MKSNNCQVEISVGDFSKGLGWEGGGLVGWHPVTACSMLHVTVENDNFVDAGFIAIEPTIAEGSRWGRGDEKVDTKKG